MDTPVDFVVTIQTLRGVERILGLILVIYSLYLGLYIPAGFVVVISLGLPPLVAWHAQEGEIRRLAEWHIQNADLKMPQALEYAKLIMEMDIKAGRRVQ